MMAHKRLGWSRLKRPVPIDPSPETCSALRKFPNTPLDGRGDYPYNLSGTEETQGEGVPINQMRIT